MKKIEEQPEAFSELVELTIGQKEYITFVFDLEKNKFPCYVVTELSLFKEEDFKWARNKAREIFFSRDPDRMEILKLWGGTDNIYD